MTRRFLLTVICVAAVTAAGCTGFEHQSSATSPSSSSGLTGLLGQWTSASIIPSPTSCTDFKWNISENTGTTAKGSFSATCAGVGYSGTAEGSLGTTGVISWTANAVATSSGASCNISLIGTAQIQVDAIVIPYSGDTCVGKVSGTETLKRK